MSFIPFAGIYLSFCSTGWRRTGAWNILAASAAGITLLCCLTVSISQPGSSLGINTVMFQGSCEATRYLNIGLHLLINLVSSAVLASSNYFMQILNAPSRQEIDQAHKTLSSLDIGIPSLKNLHFLSRFKQCFWALLLVTSLPIHLLFNSSVYETSFEGSTWQLTIAAEQFLHGAPFFPPGAKLASAGSASPIIYDPEWNETQEQIDEQNESFKKGSYYRSGDLYGSKVIMSDYWDESSNVSQKLTQISKDIITGERDRRWVHLTSKDCRLEYVNCRPRTRYNDVVVVVETSANTTGGWTRDEVYADPHDRLPDWKHHIPRDKANSLWYSTECKSFIYLNDTIGESSTCPHWGNPEPCRGVLGWSEDYDAEEYQQQEWSIIFGNTSTKAQLWDPILGYDARFNRLDVKYCMADLSASNRCKVMVANNLILVTIICVFFKVVICTLVVLRLPVESLVTPGDAIESLLSKPDSATRGLGAIDVHDVQRLEFSIPNPLSKGFEHYGLLSSTQLARTWQQKKRRIITAMPRSAWWRAYAPISLTLSLLLFLTVAAYQGNHDNFGGSFGHWGVTSVVQLGTFHYLDGLITANLGQLVLSWCYFAYNALLTRIHVEKELNGYSRSFRPLRVSFPKGAQVVTWRLQLPYKFGIPLLLLSILLHWLVSNSIFFLVKEGGYYRRDVEETIDTDPFVAVGYSPIAVLTTMILGSVLATIPFSVGFYRLPGDMVTGGSSSLVLSAMCHAFCPNHGIVDGAGNVDTAAAISTDDGTVESDDGQRTEERLSPVRRRSAASQDNPSELEDGNVQEYDFLVNLAQSKLRWGVTSLTPDLRDIVQESGQKALHLALATEETFISPPIDGEMYL